VQGLPHTPVQHLATVVLARASRELAVGMAKMVAVLACGNVTRVTTAIPSRVR
jgi:hypothetical protein